MGTLLPSTVLEPRRHPAAEASRVIRSVSSRSRSEDKLSGREKGSFQKYLREVIASIHGEDYSCSNDFKPQIQLSFTLERPRSSLILGQSSSLRW